MDSKKGLVDCVNSLYAMGLTTSASGNHSIRTGHWLWITPSEVPRLKMQPADLVRVDLNTGRVVGKSKPSIEFGMHRKIYGARCDTNAIAHTHSPFTIRLSISPKFRHVIEEAKIVVGEPAVIENRPSGSMELAAAVAGEFQKGARTVVIKNHGVAAGGRHINHALAIIESLEEWDKILTVAQVFGGASDWLG